jgi:hypothetical protein
MSQSFEELLDELRPDADAVQQAARFYLAEETGDLDEQAMRAELLHAAGADSGQIDAVIASLEGDSTLVEAACLTLLAEAWDDPDKRPAVRGCLEDAKAQMPIVETAIIAVVAAYGMYLLATRGVKRAWRVTRRFSDGSIEETEVLENESPLAPLRAIMNLGKSRPE